jgi:hypothetical protein
VLNAIGDRHAAHLQGDFPGFGAIVHFGQDMAMNVDHVERDSEQNA